MQLTSVLRQHVCSQTCSSSSCQSLGANTAQDWEDICGYIWTKNAAGIILVCKSISSQNCNHRGKMPRGQRRPLRVFQFPFLRRCVGSGLCHYYCFIKIRETGLNWCINNKFRTKKAPIIRAHKAHSTLQIFRFHHEIINKLGCDL